MNQEETIVALHNQINRIVHNAGLESTGLAISANHSVVFVYVAYKAQHKVLSAELPEMLNDFTIIVKYRGHSGRTILHDLAAEEVQ